MRSPSAGVVEQLFGAFGRDALAVARRLDEEVVWRVPGATVMSGEYRGRDDVLRFLRQTSVLTERTYRTTLQHVVAEGERVVAVYRARGARNGRTLDIDQALFCVVRDGVVVDVTAVPFDFVAFAEFWS